MRDRQVSSNDAGRAGERWSGHDSPGFEAGILKADGEFSAVPAGLGTLVVVSPALKCWAVIGRPLGLVLYAQWVISWFVPSWIATSPTPTPPGARRSLAGLRRINARLGFGRFASQST